MSAITAALCEHPEAVAVSGLVVPAELKSDAQVLFEHFGGLSKGRDCMPEVFAPPLKQSPLLPLPSFGVGANMAFRLDALLKQGGFDKDLGAGRPTFGCEDTLIFSELLDEGHTVLYDPRAITRHSHRGSLEELIGQLRGYGVGLGAFYMALVMNKPSRIVRLIALVPRALSIERGDERLGGLEVADQKRLLSGRSSALVTGAFRYLRARWSR